MAVIRVTHVTGDAFEIDVRVHRLQVDQPARDHVEAGPTPVELFVAALAACVGYYAERFLRRHDLPYEGLRVDCDWAMRAGDPARVSRIALRVTAPAAVPQELHEPLHEAIEQCTVHNSLRHPPAITIELESVHALGRA